MALSPDFKEFIELLNTHNVAHLVVGGYAVAFHGHPRYTKDIDIWIHRDPINATRMMAALDAFGFGQIGLSERDFLEPNQTIQLGLPPNRIDLLTDLEGVDFIPCYDAREEFVIEGMVVSCIGLECLKRNKRALGRYQDLADLENLE